jgi:hypothetical protein
MRMKDDGNWQEDYDAADSPEFVRGYQGLRMIY